MTHCSCENLTLTVIIAFIRLPWPVYASAYPAAYKEDVALSNHLDFSGICEILSHSFSSTASSSTLECKYLIFLILKV